MNGSRVFYLLVVDDDSLIHSSLRMALPEDWKLVSAIRRAEIPSQKFFHAAFVDMHLSGSTKADGLDILREIGRLWPQTELVAMSGDLRRELMEEGLKAGAQRFLAKPLFTEEIHLVLGKIAALWDLRQVASHAASASAKRARWIGEGPASQRVLERVASLRGEPGPILIEGESGSGKEVTARLLQQQEGERPFIAVNIGAIPDNLFESELFGHVKGAFTGADQTKIGLCEAANGGDLFLDEIEALPLPQQVKLLRFLESGEIRKVGARESQIVRCRVIAAGNKPLQDLVRQGQFREDLYFRLSAQRLELPPLRKRPEDIPTLAAYFLEAERPRRNKSFSEDGLEALKDYPWPGNVRELKRVCEQLSLISPLPLIRGEDVKRLSRSSETTAPAGHYDFSRGLTALLETYEAGAIAAALKQTSDVEAAATLLQISRSNLYRKIKDYNLESPT